METIERRFEKNRNLSEDEKLRRLKIAKGGTWYECQKSDFGFECPNCGNLIGFNQTYIRMSGFILPVLMMNLNYEPRRGHMEQPFDMFYSIAFERFESVSNRVRAVSNPFKEDISLNGI